MSEKREIGVLNHHQDLLRWSQLTGIFLFSAKLRPSYSLLIPPSGMTVCFRTPWRPFEWHWLKLFIPLAQEKGRCASEDRLKTNRYISCQRSDLHSQTILLHTTTYYYKPKFLDANGKHSSILDRLQRGILNTCLITSLWY